MSSSAWGHYLGKLFARLAQPTEFLPTLYTLFSLPGCRWTPASWLAKALFSLHNCLWPYTALSPHRLIAFSPPHFACWLALSHEHRLSHLLFVQLTPMLILTVHSSTSYFKNLSLLAPTHFLPFASLSYTSHDHNCHFICQIPPLCCDFYEDRDNVFCILVFSGQSDSMLGGGM